MHTKEREWQDSVERSDGDGAKATELSKPEATKSFRGQCQKCKWMEGGKELKPLIGNENEKRRRKAGMVIGKGSRTVFLFVVFFFMGGRPNHVCRKHGEKQKFRWMEVTQTLNTGWDLQASSAKSASLYDLLTVYVCGHPAQCVQ